MTSITKDLINDLFETVERARDEMRVQAHLGKEEAKDRVAELEERYKDMKAKRNELFEIAEDTGEGMLKGFEQSLRELRDGYRKLREKA